MRRGLALWAALLLFATTLVAKEGDELIGTLAPEWRGVTWVRGGPLTLRDLRGKVVLVRWWTAGCPMCVASASPLSALRDKYADRGLVVVGMFHPKPPQPVEDEIVLRVARQIGIHFPIAVDDDWGLLRRYWLDARRRSFTSVSFLVDQEGRIRYIHPGGEFHGRPDPPGPAPDGDAAHRACHRAFWELDALIAELLPRKG